MIAAALAACAGGAIVTVVLDGSTIDASVPARIACGVTLAPLAPFVRAFAERIERSSDGTRVRISRGGHDVVVRLTSGVPPCCMGASVPLDDARIPLAAVARALGASVAYDARTHTLAIELVPGAVATFSAAPYVAPPPGSVPTFAPHTAPTPAPTVTGIPRPRRTPILVESASSSP